MATADLETLTHGVDRKRQIVDQMVRRYLLHTQADQQELAKLYDLALLRRADHSSAIAAALGLSTEEAKVGYAAELSRLQRRYSFVFTEQERRFNQVTLELEKIPRCHERNRQPSLDRRNLAKLIAEATGASWN